MFGVVLSLVVYHYDIFEGGCIHCLCSIVGLSEEGGDIIAFWVEYMFAVVQ